MCQQLRQVTIVTYIVEQINCKPLLRCSFGIFSFSSINDSLFQKLAHHHQLINLFQNLSLQQLKTSQGEFKFLKQVLFLFLFLILTVYFSNFQGMDFHNDLCKLHIFRLQKHSLSLQDFDVLQHIRLPICTTYILLE